MSAAPFLRSRDVDAESHPVQDQISVRRRPTVKSGNRVRAVSKTLMIHIVLMTIVSVMTWGFMILLGNSMMEHARRDHVRAVERAKHARQEVARLHQRADRLASMAAIDEWARAKGFVPPAVDPETWVAEHEQATQ